MIDISTGRPLTRRNVIKGGLAAILASGTAPSLSGTADSSVGGSARGMMRNVGARSAAIFGGGKGPEVVENAYARLLNKAYFDLGNITVSDDVECVLDFRVNGDDGYSQTTHYPMFLGNNQFGFLKNETSPYYGKNHIIFYYGGSEWRTGIYVGRGLYDRNSYQFGKTVIFPGYSNLFSNSIQEQSVAFKFPQSYNGFLDIYVWGISFFRNDVKFIDFKPINTNGFASLYDTISGTTIPPIGTAEYGISST